MKRPALPLPEAAPLEVPEDLSARLEALGVTHDHRAVATLARYLGFLLAANEQMNLTAITEPAEMWTRHALDALTLVAHIPPSARVLDIGSGGGVPAIPLAIARPDVHVTLLEATQKKAGFLTDVTAALGLSNTRIVAERAETFALDPRRGTFDVVTARAVAKLVALVPLTAPFLPRNGTFLFIKGQRADDELTEAAGVLTRHRVTHIKTVTTLTGRVVVLRAEDNPPSPSSHRARPSHPSRRR